MITNDITLLPFSSKNINSRLSILQNMIGLRWPFTNRLVRQLEVRNQEDLKTISKDIYFRHLRLPTSLSDPRTPLICERFVRSYHHSFLLNDNFKTKK